MKLVYLGFRHRYWIEEMDRQKNELNFHLLRYLCPEVEAFFSASKKNNFVWNPAEKEGRCGF
jgi:hypothetical protein